MALVGYKKRFASKRSGFRQCRNHLSSFAHAQRSEDRYRWIFATRIPCVVFSRNLNPDTALLSAAREACIPVFKTPLITMRFINLATLALEMMFAPRRNEMGCMVDILGVGVLIRGESGIGKSEAVLALIERGYSLVADDITKVTLIDNQHVVGTSYETTRNLMEIRGIGIIDVAAVFGVRSVTRKNKSTWWSPSFIGTKPRPLIDWGWTRNYRHLGVHIPHIVIPVRPGRTGRLIGNAFQTKLKMSGIHSAQALSERLMEKMTRDRVPPEPRTVACQRLEFPAVTRHWLCA